MREIVGKLTDELKRHTRAEDVACSDGYEVKSFRELVEHIAKLAYTNKDWMLFYRGQKKDYINKVGKSTFYPTIYRGDYLKKHVLNDKFLLLGKACKLLVEEFKNNKIIGRTELERKKYIQWSVLQHYEVVDTPLIDLTQSLRVACSFAYMDNNTDNAFIYVFGLPYLTNRISINSEHDLVNVRLLSIMPPNALRPYFQEGFLIGTDDIYNEFKSKTELDLNRRLIAKFKLPAKSDFWSDDFSMIPMDAIYPDNDPIKKICQKIKNELGKYNYNLKGEFNGEI